MSDLSFKISASAQDFTRELENVKSQTGNVKKQFRSLTQETNNLEVAYRKLSQEEKNSPFGQYLREQIDDNISKLADFKDAIGDVQENVSKLASDTVIWDGMAQGIGVAKDSVSAFAASLGVSTKEGGLASRAINLLTRAQTFANAAISIGNALQKQSKIISAITTIQTKLQTAATNKATIAQLAFNAAAKANPYVLLASAVITVVGALWAFSDASDDAEDKTNELSEAEEKAKRVSEAYANSLYSEFSKLMSSYTKLKATWASLVNDNQRKKFIELHKGELQELGGEIKNVSDAEGFFNSDTTKIVKAFENRAKAAALAAKAAELYRQQMEIIEKNRDFLENRAYKEGERAPDSMTGVVTADKSGGTYNNGKLTLNKGQWVLTLKGAEAANKALPEWQKLNAEYQKNQEEVSNVNKEYANLIKNSQTLSKYTNDNTNNTNNNNKSVKKQIETYSEAVAEYDRLVQEKEKLNKLLSEGRVSEGGTEGLNKEINAIDGKIKEIGDKWHINPKIELEKPDQSDLDTINNIISNALHPKIELSANYDFSSLPEEFDKVADQVIESMQRIEDARRNLEKILNDPKSTDSEIAAAQQGLDELNNKYDELRDTADVYQNLSNEADKLAKHDEKVTKSLESVGNAINAAGEMFGALSELADKDEGLQVMSIVAKAVATVALSYAQALSSCKTWADWLAFGMTGLGTMISMIASIKSATSGYAEGGIIGGNSFYGDRILARVNSGEVILNKRQQQRAYELMDNGFGGANINVTGVVRGRELVLVTKNESKYMSRSGRKIQF